MRQRHILLFWLPLFSSWLLMMAEGPLISAVVNRLPDAVVHLAVLGIVFSLAVAIESPIINLLATSTAKVKDRQSYRQVRRLTLHWCAGLTLLAAAIAWTGLFDLVVVDWLGVPGEITRWVRPGMAIMVPWSAAIGWRRFLQGLLIVGGRTRAIAWGTAIRLATSAGIAATLALTTQLPGSLVGAWGLVVGVGAEAAFATVAARPVIAGFEARRDAPPLGYLELTRFHLPLAGTAVLTLLMQPLVTACLARLDRPVATLAAWPLIFQFLLLARAPALALPEVVIALAGPPENRPGLWRFTRSLTLASLGAMALFALTPLADFYLRVLQNAEPAVASLAGLGFLLMTPLPALATLISWYRGLMIQQGRTPLVNGAMLVRLVATTLLLLAGLAWQWSGIVTAASAMVLSVVAELVCLHSWSRRVGQPAADFRP